MLYKCLWFFQTLFLRLLIKHIGLISYVGKPTFIYGGKRIQIGNKVRIFPGLRAETHYNGSIQIGDDVSIGQNFHIVSSGIMLSIGSHTTISGNVFITNVDHDYTAIGEHILKQKYLEKNTMIGENCFIGYGAVLQAGTILGKQCIVGSNSVLRGTYPDYAVIAGAPAKILKRYNLNTSLWEKTDAKGNFIL
ncbi:lipopolysaccharide biosynthesis protein [Mucilaginibacter sp. PAMC 26640]|nr:lipopolysaccharide biosynthesis protein [Mucilaginibacter sp. PAMC 26640]